ncbi:hypothetical protein [Geminisphaera colitermitum]|uniref:hypothetical protein n=1 Tax=Geminisphaera colitermitum TaxID=1148786 RepID=UPI000158CF82|nr:hypothetical protein [Geminisphaera colitermitum]
MTALARHLLTLAALLLFAVTPTHATPVELQFPDPLVFTGTNPQNIRVEVETGLAISGLTITLELRRYDADARLATPSPPPLSTAQATDDMNGGGGPVFLQLTIPATGFYELTAIATDAEGKTLARKRTLLAALARPSVSNTK